MPPDAWRTETVTTTAMMIMTTSIGGLPGMQPKPKMSTARETPLDMPRKMPPTRAPTRSIPNTTMSSSKNIHYILMESLIK